MTIDELPHLPNAVSASSVLSLIEHAREAILAVYADTTMAVEYKADKSPLTLADRRSHTILTEGLTRLTPEFPILSEEGRHLDWDTRRKWDYFWLIDPLDGTRDFVERTDEFTINVALVHEERPIVGFLDVPVRQTTYLGVHDRGAYRIQDGLAVPIQAQLREPTQGFRCAVSRSHSSREAAWAEEHGVPVSEWIRAGSALKFALVAEGSADVYPRLGPTMEWDTAAGHCLVDAAGGKVHQIDGEPLRYNRENLKNPPFIAWGASPLF